jgi:hypothetical protein
MPPFALFLVSLSLTDGAVTYLLIHLVISHLHMLTRSLWMMTITFLFNVTDTGEEKDYQTSQRALTLPVLQVHGVRAPGSLGEFERQRGGRLRQQEGTGAGTTRTPVARFGAGDTKHSGTRTQRRDVMRRKIDR